jgi:hypothetical protein
MFSQPVSAGMHDRPLPALIGASSTYGPSAPPISSVACSGRLQVTGATAVLVSATRRDYVFIPAPNDTEEGTAVTLPR